MSQRSYTLFDKILMNVDQGLRAVTGSMPPLQRSNPAKGVKENPLSKQEQQQVIGLMRVDHAGEVCAQALYQGQALVARSKSVQQKLKQSAEEENDHLHWTQQRIHELGGHVSFLNPLWYVGSFSIGVLAGVAGDQWNLGFLAETEKQVVKHIDSHLQQLPPQEQKAKKILEQMREDELHHATVAIENGGAPLPKAIKKVMAAMSKVMTKTTYRF